MKKPSREDVSKPKVEEYAYKKDFYRDPAVAADYDQHRFTTPRRQRRNVRKWRAIQRAIEEAAGSRAALEAMELDEMEELWQQVKLHRRQEGIE